MVSPVVTLHISCSPSKLSEAAGDTNARATIPAMSVDHEARKAFKVHGIVQGVGFRWWAQREGRHLGLRGSVRNCSDGTVEIAFAGPPGLVSEMEARLRQGPPAAHVVRLEELATPEHLPEGFEIGF